MFKSKNNDGLKTNVYCQPRQNIKLLKKTMEYNQGKN